MPNHQENQRQAMRKDRLTNVTYIHAAPQDCKPGTGILPMYRPGDIVRVDREGFAPMTIELQIADEANG
jgi:hypothetical protein